MPKAGHGGSFKLLTLARIVLRFELTKRMILLLYLVHELGNPFGLDFLNTGGKSVASYPKLSRDF